jgi:lysophospholipase L1-like esterase
MERFRKNGKVHYNKPPWFEGIYKRSHLLRGILIEFYGFDKHMMVVNEYGQELKTAVQQINDCLSIANALCQERGVKFLAITHPIPQDICQPSAKSMATYELFHGQLSGIPAIHLTEPLMNRLTETDCNAYFWPVDGHFNASGYQLMAEEVFNSILEQQPAFLISDPLE